MQDCNVEILSVDVDEDRVYLRVDGIEDFSISKTEFEGMVNGFWPDSYAALVVQMAVRCAEDGVAFNWLSFKNAVEAEPLRR